MALTGRQLQDICSALIDAYQSPDDLRIMVRFELNEKLEAIASGDNLRVVIFNLTTWAERTGRVNDLVEGAWRHNSGNAALQALAQAWRVNSPPDALPTQPSLRTEAAEPAAPVSIDVFLSYSRKDLDAMRVVRDSLRESGLSVWTDEGLEPGTPNWKNAISEAVGQAQAFVVLLSPYARESVWVNNETSYARTFDKRIFPVLVAGDSKSAVPIDLINAQWLDGREHLRDAVLYTLLPLLRGQNSSPIPTTSVPIAPAKEDIPRKEGTLFTKRCHAEAPIRGNLDGPELCRLCCGWGRHGGRGRGRDRGLVAAQTGLMAVVLAGAVLGATAGASQWIILRRHFSDAYWWVLVSVAGMAVGSAAASAVAYQVPLQAGAVIGAVVGRRPGPASGLFCGGTFLTHIGGCWPALSAWLWALP